LVVLAAKPPKQPRKQSIRRPSRCHIPLAVIARAAAPPHAAADRGPSAAAESARSLAQSSAPRASSGRSIHRSCNCSPGAPFLNRRLGGARKPANLAPHRRMANKDIRAHPTVRTKHKGQRTRRDVPAFVLCCVALLFWPNDSGSHAGACDTPHLAKEPLPPSIVIQCSVASTPAATGAGLASRLVL